MADRLPPLRISQAPRPASAFSDWKRNVDQWAQDYHFALREIEKYLDGLDLSALGSGTSSTGVSGAAGAQGPQGPQGPAGPKGEQGLQGKQGLTGLSGADKVGPAGTNGRTWSYGTANPPDSPTLSSMAAGDFYIDALTADVFVKTTAAPGYLKLLNLKGPKGSDGGLNAKAARLEQGSASILTLPAGTNSLVVPFGVKAYDTSSLVSVSTPPNQYFSLIPDNVVLKHYCFSAQVVFSAHSSGDREVIIEKQNGLIWEPVSNVTAPAASGVETALNLSTLVAVPPNGVTQLYRVSARTISTTAAVTLYPASTFFCVQFLGYSG